MCHSQQWRTNMNGGLYDFQLGFEVSPIIFTNGIAQELPNGQMPIISITQSGDYDGGLLNGSLSLNLEDYFAIFKPLPGGQLVSNQIGTYPFANQTVAANAIITQPIMISMLMICPARGIGGYQTKLETITALKQAFEQHNSLGGTYTIATPAYIYSECIMVGFRDVSSGESKQAQMEWQIDFMRPLLTEEDAEQVMNSLMAKIDGGLPQSAEPSWSGNENSTDPIMGSFPGVAGSDNLVGSSVRVTNDQSLVA